MNNMLGNEKVKIDGDDGLLGVWADHEEARWGKRVASISWGGAFPRKATPQASDGKWRHKATFVEDGDYSMEDYCAPLKGEEKWKYWKVVFGLVG